MWIRKKIEKLRMNIEANRILKELEQNPEFDELKPPPELKERVYAEIERREQEKQRILSEEQQELIRMGIRYQKQKKRRKYMVAAAIVVLLFSMGMTCFGGAEKVFYRISSMFINRSREVVDSGNVQVIGDCKEEEVYAEIEEKFGFYPVKVIYLSQGTSFQEACIYDDLSVAQMIYTKNSEVKIIYWIHTNYKDSSVVKDYEDILIEEYELKKGNTIFDIKMYEVENEEVRGLIQFEYREISYSVYIMNTNKSEIKSIVENLHMS